MKAPVKDSSRARVCRFSGAPQARGAAFRAMLVALTGLAVGCAGNPSAEPASPGSAPVQPDQVSLSRVVVSPTGTATLPELYEEAHAKARAGDLDGAAALFDRIVALEPRGTLAADALFSAAEAHDARLHHRAALERYRQVAERYPAHRLARSAIVRSLRLLAFLEEYGAAGHFADRLLQDLPELRPIERIVAYSGKALSLVSAGDDVRAGSYVSRGRDVVETERLDLAGRVPIELAQLYFAEGEVLRTRGERIRFVPRPENLAATLERRCQFVLDAQRAYSDTWRAYDPHWSTMAGFRVGELYQRLHQDLMALGPPEAADTEPRKELFEAAMRLRLTVLLEKARGMMEHTLAMAERERERSDWVGRAREALAAIEAAERREQAALDRVPYSRADIEEALAEITKKAKAPPEAAGPKKSPHGPKKSPQQGGAK